MPNVVDYTVTAGYENGRLCIPISLSQQRTEGGGDIRRQDMPFVSNRMDWVRVDGRVIYTLPAPRDRKSTRLNSSHGYISYAVFCLKKKKTTGEMSRGGSAAMQGRPV